MRPAAFLEPWRLPGLAWRLWPEFGNLRDFKHPFSERSLSQSHLLLATSLAPYRSHSGPKSQKVEKRFPGPLGPEVKKGQNKSRKKAEKVEKRLFLSRFRPFLDFFSTLFDPGVERPREPFLDFFGISGPNDSCKGPRRLQPSSVPEREGS